MRTRFDLTASRRLAAVFREQQCEILHAHTPRSLMVAAARPDCSVVAGVSRAQPGRPRFKTQVDQSSQYLVGDPQSGSSRPADLRLSQPPRIHAGLGHPEEKLRVVHNGVATSPREVELGSQSVQWTLGMVALFRPRKGLEVLLEALSVLAEQQLPVRLKCVGAFETEAYEREITELAER